MLSCPQKLNSKKPRRPLLQIDIYDPDAHKVLYTQDLHTGSQI